MLRSADAREQAWGRGYASRDRMRERLPDLQQMAACDIALDALIQMESEPAPDLLADIYRVSPDRALILASHTTDSSPDEFLLHVLRESENERWFAAANLLLSRKSAGLASGILSGATSRIRLCGERRRIATPSLERIRGTITDRFGRLLQVLVSAGC